MLGRGTGRTTPVRRGGRDGNLSSDEAVRSRPRDFLSLRWRGSFMPRAALTQGGKCMMKSSTLALVVPLALGLGMAVQEAGAAPASSGALNVLMSGEALRADVTNEAIKDGLVQPAYYYYRRRYYRPYRYGYYGRP